MRKRPIITLAFLIMFVGAVWVIATDRIFVVGLDSPEAIAIQETIRQIEIIKGEAIRNGGDTSVFDRYMADTDDFQETNEIRLAFIEKVLGSEAARHPGYLTQTRAQIQSLGCGYHLYEEAYWRAVREDGQITEEERSAIEDQCAWKPTERIPEPLPLVEYSFREIRIKGERATAVYLRRGCLEVATLIRTDGRWRVSAVKYSRTCN